MSTPFRDDQSAVTLTGYGCAVEKLLLLARDLPSPCGACKRGSPIQHAEDAKGFSPFNPARKRAAEVRREDQSHLQGASLPSPCGGCRGVLPFSMRRMQRGKLPFQPRPQTSSGGAQRRPVASSGASLPLPWGGCTGVLSFTMRRMQRGSPLSTPPANEQRRCAEQTSRIFRPRRA